MDCALRSSCQSRGGNGKWLPLSFLIFFSFFVGCSRERSREQACRGEAQLLCNFHPYRCWPSVGSSGLGGILQKGDLMRSWVWGVRWAALAACSPSTRRVGSASWRNKGTFSTFFLSFISQAETDSIRCKTKCQEKDVCYTEWCCCCEPACLSLAAFCSASSTDKVIQRF